MHQKDIQNDIKTFTLFYRQEFCNVYLDLFDTTGSTNLYATSDLNFQMTALMFMESLPYIFTYLPVKVELVKIRTTFTFSGNSPSRSPISAFLSF